MFNVNVNYENPNTVILNFEEMINSYPDSLYRCEEEIESFKKEFHNLADYIDEPQDYYYIITCNDEYEAENVETYLENSFSSIEEELAELEEFNDDECFEF